MTFNPSVPLNSDSPSIFPSQNQTNMNRLQTLLGADHQFNTSAAANDGYHNLIHMTQQAPSGALASTGRLYVKSIGGTINLFYMDDAGTEQQLTPFSSIGTIKISGSQSLAASASFTIFNPSYDFVGFGTAYISGTNIQNTYNFMKTSGATQINRINFNGASPNFPPSIQFSGTDLTVTNQSSSTQTILWSLMINRA